MPSRTNHPQDDAKPLAELQPKPSAVVDTSIEGQLQQMIVAMIDAINARDFDPLSIYWVPTDEDFIAQPDYRFDDIQCSLSEWLCLAEETTKEFPEYSVVLKDVNIHLNSKGEHANCFAEFETHGAPPGITKQTVGIIEFAMVAGGVWRCKKYRCLPGMDILDRERLHAQTRTETKQWH